MDMFAMSRVRHSSPLLLQSGAARYCPPAQPGRSSHLRRLPPWRFCAADGMREVGLAAVAMTPLRYEGNSVRYGDISGLVDQSEVHVDVQVRGPSMLVFSGTPIPLSIQSQSFLSTIDLFATNAAGGTAFNGVVEELKKLTTRVAHVLPVSDDGGSTAEIVRVLGTGSCPNFLHAGGFKWVEVACML